MRKHITAVGSKLPWHQNW